MNEKAKTEWMDMARGEGLVDPRLLNIFGEAMADLAENWVDAPRCFREGPTDSNHRHWARVFAGLHNQPGFWIDTTTRHMCYQLEIATTFVGFEWATLSDMRDWMGRLHHSSRGNVARAGVMA